VSITLSNLSKDTLSSILPTLVKKRDVIKGELATAEAAVVQKKADLAAVETDIRAINSVLLPPPYSPTTVKTVKVRSDSDWFKFYDVTRTENKFGYPQFTYKCTCKSFIFASGLDAAGYCKHIAKAIKDRLF
jgi:hypothetical protein